MRVPSYKPGDDVVVSVALVCVQILAAFYLYPIMPERWPSTEG